MTGFVYIIRPIRYAGPIKIGHSNQPKVRLADLARWSPIALEIVAFQAGDVALERRLHARFASHHSHHEWFHPAVELLAFVANVEKGMSFEDAINLDDAQGNIRTKGKITDEEREYRRWRMRYHYACERLPFRFKSAHRDVPENIKAIMTQWKVLKNEGDGVRRKRPDEEQMKMLACFVSNPKLFAQSASVA